ncbi:MAG: hypothetical protein KGM24_08375, partial [Elusimicrobia bacterium]|nr:hypothetical protein [Elusimicrobiota bacterium]
PAPRPPSAAARLDPRAEPSLPTGLNIQDKPYPELRYARFAGRAPDGPLLPDEIVQGQLGSCFFLSALAAVDGVRPDLVSRELRPTGDGTYAVTLYGRDGRPRAVAVDDRFPATEGGVQYLARGSSPGEIRPALFEKAYAKLLGGYRAIDGGDASAALAALTGAPAEDDDPRKLSPDEAWRLLEDAGRRGLPVEASTPEFDGLERLTGRKDLAGLIDDHDYDVLGVADEGGRRVVRLYTPLTPRDAGDAPLDARRIDVPLAEFLKDFDGLTIGSFPPARSVLTDSPRSFP